MPTPSAESRRLLAPLVADPGRSAVVTDFDGTLSPIVDDPALARGLDGTAELLARLAGRFGVVAVVSGRPVSFLADRLSPVPAAVQLVGLYGLEWSGPDATVITEPEAEAWRPVVAAVADQLAARAPAGVAVERKGLTVTVHWRQVPEAGSWVEAEVAGQAERTGLRAHPGRLSVELRPELGIDKGTTVRRLVEGCSAACYLGDDLGDLPAFSVLDELGRQGMTTVTVAVVDQESAPEVARAADLTVVGPGEAVALLEWMAPATEPH